MTRNDFELLTKKKAKNSNNNERKRNINEYCMDFVHFTTQCIVYGSDLVHWAKTAAITTIMIDRCKLIKCISF